MSEFSLYNLEGFEPHNYEALVAKLGNFAIDGLDSIHIVADSDDTLLVANRPDDSSETPSAEVEGISSWEVLEYLLPLKGREAERELYRRYHPKELDGSLTRGQAMRWLIESLRRQVKFETNTKHLPGIIRRLGVQPRDGTTELFRQCSILGIPTVILSAGVGNVGEIVASEHGIRPDVVVTNWLATDPPRPNTGRVVDWDHKSLVHPLNKFERGHQAISKVQGIRPNTILIGNDLHDPKMVEGKKNVVRVHVMDKAPNPEIVAASKNAGYDAIVVGTLAPVCGFIELLRETVQLTG